jgi:hypothetical protein
VIDFNLYIFEKSNHFSAFQMDNNAGLVFIIISKLYGILRGCCYRRLGIFI